jgi:glutamate formiminotransferase
MSLVECVPNFSEGRRAEVLEPILAAIRGVPGVKLIDHSMDASHNRAVVTFVGAPQATAEAAFHAIDCARERIDLTKHQGEHPRIGSRRARRTRAADPGLLLRGRRQAPRAPQSARRAQPRL